MMMNIMQEKRLDMVGLENVNGGGFFDFVEDCFDIAKDFVCDTVENMKVPATSVGEFIADGLIDKLTEKMVDVLHI